MYKMIKELDIKPTYIFKDNNIYDILYFDIETTGFSPVKNKIIEIGAVKVKAGEIVDHFSVFVNQGIFIKNFKRIQLRKCLWLFLMP